MFVLTTVGWFPTVIFCLLHKVVCAYIYVLFSKKMTEQRMLFLSQKIVSFFSYKKTYFCESMNIGVERNQIFLPVQCGVFSLRITFTRFNPGYIFLPLIYFFLVLIVCYNALFIYCQLNLFCYCYFVI